MAIHLFIFLDKLKNYYSYDRNADRTKPKVTDHIDSTSTFSPVLLDDKIEISSQTDVFEIEQVPYLGWQKYNYQLEKIPEERVWKLAEKFLNHGSIELVFENLKKFKIPKNSIDNLSMINPKLLFDLNNYYLKLQKNHSPIKVDEIFELSESQILRLIETQGFKNVLNNSNLKSRIFKDSEIFNKIIEKKAKELGWHIHDYYFCPKSQNFGISEEQLKNLAMKLIENKEFNLLLSTPKLFHQVQNERCISNFVDEKIKSDPKEILYDYELYSLELTEPQFVELAKSLYNLKPDPFECLKSFIEFSKKNPKLIDTLLEIDYDLLFKCTDVLKLMNPHQLFNLLKKVIERKLQLRGVDSSKFFENFKVSEEKILQIIYPIISEYKNNEDFYSMVNNDTFLVLLFLLFMQTPRETNLKLIDRLKNSKEILYNDHKFQILNFLILSSLTESPENAEIIFSKICDVIDSPKEKQHKMLATILAFCNLNEIEKLKTIDLNKLDKTSLITCLLSKLYIDKQNIQSDFLIKALNKIKDPTNLLIYLGKIYTLKSEEKEMMLNFYRDYIISILNESPLSSPHIQKIKELEPQSEAILEKWQNLNIKEPISMIIVEDQKSQLPHEKFKYFLKERLILDKHVKDIETRYPSFYEYLNSLSADPILDESSYKKYLGEIKTKINNCKNNDLLNSLKIENQLLNGCQDLKRCKDHKETQFSIKTLISLILKEKDENLDQLHADMLEFKTSLEKSLKDNDLHFEVSNNFEDLLNLGRETGGCQNIDGDAEYNKCLVGYFDGKNKIFSIKNKKGEMVARSISRLLWNETAKSCALFLEPVYSLHDANEFDNIIKDFAIKIAQELNIALFVSDRFEHNFDYLYFITHKNDSTKSVSLKSFGCIAPFEYCDSVEDNDNRITSGKYCIDHAILVFKPNL